MNEKNFIKDFYDWYLTDKVSYSVLEEFVEMVKKLERKRVLDVIKKKVEK